MTLARWVLPALALLLGGMRAAATPGGEESAAALWAGFLEKYASTALAPKPTEECERLGRDALFAAAGPRYHRLRDHTGRSVPEAVLAVAAEDTRGDAFFWMEACLARLLPQLDRYGLYQTANETTQLAEVARQRGGSVHMTLDIGEGGRPLCFPYPDGPAAKAGVLHGAELLSVDGIPTEGKGLGALQLAFAGPVGSTVRLQLRQPHGKQEEIGIERGPAITWDLSVDETPVGLRARVRWIEGGTATRLRAKLAEAKPDQRFILDLRGCTGGNLEESVRFAAAFLPEGTRIAEAESRLGRKALDDTDPQAYRARSIRILTDASSASGAELIAAALRHNLPDIARLVGQKTYGKGVSTIKISVPGGGMARFTEQKLFGPDGKSWDGTGLEPDEAGAAPAR